MAHLKWFSNKISNAFLKFYSNNNIFRIGILTLDLVMKLEMFPLDVQTIEFTFASKYIVYYIILKNKFLLK